MEWVLECWDGGELRLEQPVEWELEYTAGTPCDSFSLTCPWEPGGLDGAQRAAGFRLEDGGSLLFRGVVDETAYRADGGGGALEVSGRGMAALLLDNEAMPADYETATAEDILRDHVAPYGIQVGAMGDLPAVSGFSVQSGESEWQVLYQFARYHGGVSPRFDREGRLLLTPFADREAVLLDDQVAVTSLSWRVKRYGVLSEIWVRDRTRQAVEKVANQAFLDQGGRRRQVMTMPGKSNYLAMRYSGEFQLRRSESEQVRLAVTVPRLFFAWPGDLVRMDLAGWSFGGDWRVLSAKVRADETGGRTVLELGEPGAVL